MGTALLLLLAATSASLDVSVTTKDGQVVDGKVKLTTLKLKTDFGSATVDADRIAEVTLGEPDIVVTKGDHEIRGRIALTSLRIETASGRRTLKRAEIASFVVLEEGRPRGAAGFEGAWMCTFGNAQSPMKLKQKGLTVTGTYGHRDQFSIEGKVKGRTLALKVKEGNANAGGSVELWEDGSIFLGEVDYGRGPMVFAAYRFAPRAAPPKPGKVTEGQSKAGLEYLLHVPANYDGKRNYPAILITHGSNANSRAYVETFPAQWPALAADYVIVGVNGERLSAGSRPGNVGHNATYVNFGGPGRGMPWAHRQTPALLAETVQELKQQLPLGKVFLGGHSQGGFLTYITFLYYPQLFDGAFPMSCNLLVQCEPDNHRNHEALHHIAVAPIHGQADRVVAFSGGEYCYQRMQEFGFPRLHAFFPQSVGHGFMFLPVEEAVRWLETMSSDDPETLLKFAEQQLAAKEYRDAAGAALRASALDKGGAVKARVATVLAKVDEKAAPEAKKLLAAIKANKNNRWVDDFWEFRRRFAHTPAARSCVEAYEELKSKHQGPADKLVGEARRTRDKNQRTAKYQEVLDEYYASSWWILVKNWVKD